MDFQLSKDSASIDWALLNEKASVFHHKEFVDFQAVLGLNPWFFVAKENGTLKGFISIYIKRSAGFTYGLLQKEAWLQTNMDFYAELVQALKGELMWVDATSNMARFPELNLPTMRKARYGTFVVDLTKDETVLWEAVHSKHRNSVRSAEKKGVVIQLAQSPGKAFQIIRDTLTRASQSFYSQYEFDLFYDHLVKKEKALVLEAMCEGVLQGAIVVPYSKTGAFYLYGGSIPKPVSGAMNLLHWTMIKELKKRGVAFYDFGGARYNPDENSKAYTLQKFKKRFGGTFQDCWMWDVALNQPMYRLAKGLKKASALVKGQGWKSTLDQEIERHEHPS